MSAVTQGGGRPSNGQSGAARSESGPTFEPRQWRQIAVITAMALAIFVGFRLLPTGTNLSHMDFRVDPKAGNAIEFCDPANPQFIPVVAARSPVAMSVAATEPAQAGRDVRALVTLKTSSGKPVAPEDLLVTHTRRLHLLIVDPTLRDYQHVHPEPTRKPGEWAFTFAPRAAGAYRVFADFTPAATGRGLYASADLAVGGEPAATAGSVEAEPSEYVFALKPAAAPQAGQPIDLRFSIERPGGEVPLQPVMGAFAHLVAFDQARSGFAHLHPNETDLAKPPDPRRPVLNFKLTIPQPGRYVVWAQINLGGRERFVPFDLDVK